MQLSVPTPADVTVESARASVVPMDPTDAKSFRTIMGRFATGVTVVTYTCDEAPAGLTANGFLSVSMKPPLVLVSVRRESRFTQQVNLGSRYGVNLLAERQQYLSGHFGGRPDESVTPGYWQYDSLPMLEDCLGYIGTTVVDIHAAGDHLLYIGEINYLAVGADAAPLIFFGGRYKRLQAHMPAFSVTAGSDWW
jgi:flavin reductase (DIM6/NTAB) family NADH-FMN oxidoreductase RutF